MTYKDSDEATVESNLTFDGSNVTVNGGLSSLNGLSGGYGTPSYFQSKIGVGTNEPLAPIHISTEIDTGIILQSSDAYSVITFKDNNTTSTTSTYAGAVANNFVIAVGSSE